MSPAHALLLGWFIGAVLTAAWAASAVVGGTAPDLVGDHSEEARRRFRRGVAFGLVLLVIAWPAFLLLTLVNRLLADREAP